MENENLEQIFQGYAESVWEKFHRKYPGQIGNSTGPISGEKETTTTNAPIPTSSHGNPRKKHSKHSGKRTLDLDEEVRRARRTAAVKISSAKSAMWLVCKAKGVDSPSEILMRNENPEALKKLLKTYLQKKSDISTSTKRQLRYCFNCVMKHFKGENEKEARPDPGLIEAWEKIVPAKGTFEKKIVLPAVRKAVRWFVSKGIGPEQVGIENTAELLSYLKNECSYANPRKVYAEIRRGFELINPEMFPKEKFYKPVDINDPYALRIEQWNPQMRNDFLDHREFSLDPRGKMHLLVTDVPDKFRKKLKKKPSTLVGKKEALERFVGFTVNVAGREVDCLSWKELYEVENIVNFVDFLKNRNGGKDTAYHYRILDNLKSFLRFYLIYRRGWDEKLLVAINDIQMWISVDKKEDDIDYEELYRQMISVANVLRDERARKLEGKYCDWKLALNCQYELAIRILENIPLRPGNLRSIEIDIHLKNTETGYVFDLPGSMVKNGQPIYRELPESLQKLLVEYREKWRPVLLGDSNCKHLLIKQNGVPLDANDLWRKFTRLTYRHIGKRVGPNTLRSAFATSYLTHHEGDTFTVSEALVHNSPITAFKHYIKIKKKKSSQKAYDHYDKILSEVENSERVKQESSSREVLNGVAGVLDELERYAAAEFRKAVPNERAYRTIRKDLKGKFRDANKMIREIVTSKGNEN